jgi:hypothetical protein
MGVGPLNPKIKKEKKRRECCLLKGRERERRRIEVG